MLKKKNAYRVAVVGATGAVGAEMIEVLEERKFPVETLFPLASARSAGGTVVFQGQDVIVEELTKESFEGIDIALFSAGADVSREYAPIAAKAGAVVIDNSATWRMDKNVPLVVPEVNPHDVEHHQNIDVRVKTEVSTAVPAECENGRRVLGVRCLGIQPLQQRVDAPRVPLCHVLEHAQLAAEGRSGVRTEDQRHGAEACVLGEVERPPGGAGDAARQVELTEREVGGGVAGHQGRSADPLEHRGCHRILEPER